MTTVKIKILQQDIDDSIMFNAGYCPVAKCLRREYSNHEFFSVGSRFVIIGNKRYTPEKDMRLFIFNYDNGFYVGPEILSMTVWEKPKNKRKVIYEK